MKNIKIISRDNILSFITFMIFIICLATFGPLWGGDSGGYVNFAIHREPLYAMFCQMWGAVLGQETDVYLYVICVCQILLAVVSIRVFISKMHRIFNLQGFAVALSYIMFIGLYCLTRFFTHTGLIIFNCILMEGVTVSLFLLFSAYTLESVCMLNKRAWYISLVFAFILIMIRSQMLILLGVVLVSRIIMAYKSKDKNGVKILLSLLLIPTVALGANLIERIYFYGHTGQNMTHTYGPVTSMSNVMYLGRAEDVALFEGEEAIIYEKTFEKMTEKGWRYEDTDKSSVFTLENALYNHHDDIKFRAFDPVVDDYLKDAGIKDKVNAAKIRDEFAMDILKTILPVHFADWVVNYLALFFGGIMRSVVFLGISSPISIAQFILVIALYCIAVVLFRRNKSLMLYFIFAVGMTVLNAAATAVVIMCLSRYMFYGMALIYFGLILALNELVRKWRQKDAG